MRTSGINHLALVARDMAETVDFYSRSSGMPLVKTVALPDDGQHFFFDCGGGSTLAFFWWPQTPACRTWNCVGCAISERCEDRSWVDEPPRFYRCR